MSERPIPVPTDLRVIGGFVLRFFLIGGALAAAALGASLYIGAWAAPIYVAALASGFHAMRWIFGVERRRLWWSWRALAEGTGLELVELSEGAPGFDRALRGQVGGHPVEVRLMRGGARSSPLLRVTVWVGNRVPRGLPAEVKLQGDTVARGLCRGLWPFTEREARARSGELQEVVAGLVALVDGFPLVQARAPDGAFSLADGVAGAVSVVEPGPSE